LFNEQFVPAATTRLPLTLERAEGRKANMGSEHLYPEYQEVKQPDGDESKCNLRAYFMPINLMVSG